MILLQLAGTVKPYMRLDYDLPVPQRSPLPTETELQKSSSAPTFGRNLELFVEQNDLQLTPSIALPP